MRKLVIDDILHSEEHVRAVIRDLSEEMVEIDKELHYLADQRIYVDSIRLKYIKALREAYPEEEE